MHVRNLFTAALIGACGYLRSLKPVNDMGGVNFGQLADAGITGD